MNNRILLVAMLLELLLIIGGLFFLYSSNNKKIEFKNINQIKSKQYVDEYGQKLSLGISGPLTNEAGNSYFQVVGVFRQMTKSLLGSYTLILDTVLNDRLVQIKVNVPNGDYALTRLKNEKLPNGDTAHTMYNEKMSILASDLRNNQNKVVKMEFLLATAKKPNPCNHICEERLEQLTAYGAANKKFINNMNMTWETISLGAPMSLYFSN